MKSLWRVLRLTALFLCPTLLSIMAATDTPPVTTSEWFGCRRLDFVVEGRPALLIVPVKAAPGNPWIWRPEWFGDFPQVDLALVARGWHVGYINVKDMYGGPHSLALMDAFYHRVTKDYALAKRVVLEGFSRGGLCAFNFVAKWSDRTSALYLDAAVLDLNSWPSPRSPLWAEAAASYGLTPEQLAKAKVSPLDHIATVARAGIPIYCVSGDADESVPYLENTALLVERYRAAGGVIEVVVKPGGKHHPHSLADPTPIVEFLLQHAKM
ncbi:MAG: prolyl oligopeptidase family serine peptidase [Opitutaceae bacterium]